MGDPFPELGDIVIYVTNQAEHWAAMVIRIDPQNSRVVTLNAFHPGTGYTFPRFGVPYDKGAGLESWHFREYPPST